MKLFTLSIVTVLFTLFVSSCSQDMTTKGGAKSEDELVELLKESFRDKDINKLMQLIYTKDSPDFVLDSKREYNERFLQNLNVTSFEVIDIDEKLKERMSKGHDYKGRVMIPNLDVTKNVVVSFKSEKSKGSVSFLMGKAEGKFFFTSSKFK